LKNDELRQTSRNFTKLRELLCVDDAGVDEASASWICPTPAPPGECEDDATESDDSDDHLPDY